MGYSVEGGMHRCCYLPTSDPTTAGSVRVTDAYAKKEVQMKGVEPSPKWIRYGASFCTLYRRVVAVAVGHKIIFWHFIQQRDSPLPLSGFPTRRDCRREGAFREHDAPLAHFLVQPEVIENNHHKQNP